VRLLQTNNVGASSNDAVDDCRSVDTGALSLRPRPIHIVRHDSEIARLRRSYFRGRWFLHQYLRDRPLAVYGATTKRFLIFRVSTGWYGGCIMDALTTALLSRKKRKAHNRAAFLRCGRCNKYSAASVTHLERHWPRQRAISRWIGKGPKHFFDADKALILYRFISHRTSPVRRHDYISKRRKGTP